MNHFQFLSIAHQTQHEIHKTLIKTRTSNKRGFFGLIGLQGPTAAHVKFFACSQPQEKLSPSKRYLQGIYQYTFYMLQFHLCHILCLRIGSCFACVYQVMDAHGKFGGHERRVRVALGCASSNSSFLSALQTSQVHP